MLNSSSTFPVLSSRNLAWASRLSSALLNLLKNMKNVCEWAAILEIIVAWNATRAGSGMEIIPNLFPSLYLEIPGEGVLLYLS